MVYMPFIYFLLAFLFIYLRRGLDASAYVTLLYVINSFFSIILMSQRLPPVSPQYITIQPTLVYCALITLFIVPIYNFNTKKITVSRNANIKFINWIAYFYVATFVLLIVFYFQDILRNFVLSDLKEAKQMIRLEGLNITKYPIYIESFLYVARMFSPFSLVLLFVYFYSTAFLNKSNKFNLLILLGSLSGIVMGILNIDRSKVLYWVLMFGLCATMFWRLLGKGKKKEIKKYVFVIFLLLISYFTIITIGRWGNSSGGASHSLLSYAGQSYLNFCYFFNEFDNIDGITLKYLFPAFHHFVLGDYDGSLSLQADLTDRTGIYTSIFYSLLGDFIVSDGKAGLIIYPIVYLIVCKIVLKKRGENISFDNYFLSFLVMIIPTVGIIAYYYANFVMTLSLIMVIILQRVLNRHSNHTWLSRNK